MPFCKGARRTSTFDGRVFLSGWFGQENFGDDAILAAHVHLLRQAGIHEIAAVTWNPAAARRERVKAVAATRPLERLRASANSDLVIVGGGGLAKEVADGGMEVPIMLSDAIGAKIVGRRLAFFGTGVGPFRTRAGRRATADILNRADALYLRDEESVRAASLAGVDQPMVEIPDVVFALESAPREPIVEGVIGVNLRRWFPPAGTSQADADSRVADAARLIARELAEAHAAGVVPLLLRTRAGDDDRLAVAPLVEACRAWGIRVHDPIDLASLPTAEALDAMGRLDLVVSMRLHGSIAAACRHVPFVPIAYDPKVRGLAGALDVGRHMLDLADPTGWRGVVAGAMAERAKLREHLAVRAPRMRAAVERAHDRMLADLEARAPRGGRAMALGYVGRLVAHRATRAWRRA